MFSLLIKLIVPAASAISINGYYRTPVAPAEFAGQYQVVSSSELCAQGTSEVVYSAEDNSVSVLLEGQEPISFTRIDEGTFEGRDTVSDGHGVLKSVISDRSTMRVTTLIASLKEGILVLERTIQSPFSRGQGSRIEKCVLQK